MPAQPRVRREITPPTPRLADGQLSGGLEPSSSGAAGRQAKIRSLWGRDSEGSLGDLVSLPRRGKQEQQDAGGQLVEHLDLTSFEGADCRRAPSASRRSLCLGARCGRGLSWGLRGLPNGHRSQVPGPDRSATRRRLAVDVEIRAAAARPPDTYERLAGCPAKGEKSGCRKPFKYRRIYAPGRKTCHPMTRWPLLIAAAALDG
jgi:hypothetical protein